jgi:KDO2-lipid IV(A) lauroyltransferase
VTLLHRLENGALSAAGAGLRAASWPAAQRFGEGLGRAAARLAGRRWRLTLDNLRTAFPDRPQAELESYALQCWENLGRMGAECIWSEYRAASEIARWVSFENVEPLRETLKESGLLIHLGHFANWETAGLAFSALGLPLTVVARRIKNPLLNARVNSLRSRFGTHVLSHKNPFFGCVRALKERRCLGILMDQSLPTGGVFAPFFGRPAATTPLTAHLAHRTGVPIYSLRIRREGPRIIGTFDGPVPLGATVEETAVRLTAIIERWARERPGEWFWFHDRWKRAKEAAAADPAAA